MTWFQHERNVKAKGKEVHMERTGTSFPNKIESGKGNIPILLIGAHPACNLALNPFLRFARFAERAC